MTAYIIRRLLFMMPTMFGIMLVAFVVVQFAPGGPVEQVIAKLTGADTGATSRISGSPGGDFGSRGLVQGGSGVDAVTSKYRGAQGLDPGIHQEAGKAVRLRQAGLRALRPDAVELYPLRFRQELFPRRQRVAVDQGEAAGVDLARHLDDVAHLPDLDPARHPQGGRRRLALRRVDLDRDRRRLRHPRLSVRDLADHPVRRRLVLRLVPAARAGVGEFLATAVVRQDRRLFLAPDAADHLDGAVGLRHHDAADQELVPRGDPQAIRAHRARQGLHAATRCCTATSSATPC